MWIKDLQMQTWSQNGFGCISVFPNDTYGRTYLWIDKHAGRCSCAHMSHLALRQWLKLKNTGDSAAPTVSHCLCRVDFWEGIQEFVGGCINAYMHCHSSAKTNISNTFILFLHRVQDTCSLWKKKNAPQVNRREWKALKAKEWWPIKLKALFPRTVKERENKGSRRG